MLATTVASLVCSPSPILRHDCIFITVIVEDGSAESKQRWEVRQESFQLGRSNCFCSEPEAFEGEYNDEEFEDGEFEDLDLVRGVLFFSVAV